jgi:hypothetical protein
LEGFHGGVLKSDLLKVVRRKIKVVNPDRSTVSAAYPGLVKQLASLIRQEMRGAASVRFPNPAA